MKTLYHALTLLLCAPILFTACHHHRDERPPHRNHSYSSPSQHNNGQHRYHKQHPKSNNHPFNPNDLPPDFEML